MSSDALEAAGPVLVVDDDPGLREIIQEVLQDEGLMVDVAADGSQALESVARRRPRLVVLDWGLPLLDGGAVASQLRKLCGEGARILIMTADGRAAERARQVQASGYLHKPFDVDMLVTAVRRALPET